MLSYIDDFFDQVYVEVAVLILMDVLSYHFYLRKNVGATHVAVVSL
ncbi:MAG: hypothetical protein HRU41_40980 [Saprospiraceae bacterium]|nr:hypothetical protein [Saprospiraceae bacterium]